MACNYRKATSSIANKFEEIKVKNDCREPRLPSVSDVRAASHTLNNVYKGVLEKKIGVNISSIVEIKTLSGLDSVSNNHLIY